MTEEVLTRPTTSDVERDDFSLWLALAAGEAAWNDTADEVLPMQRLAATLSVVAYATTTVVCWIGFLMRDNPSTFATLAPWIATAAISLLATRPIRLLRCRRRPVALWPSAAWRALLVVTVASALMPNAPAYGILSIWPLAIAIGSESAMVAWATGLEVRPRDWWVAFVRSPLHLGVLGGVLAAALKLGPAPTLSAIIPTYLVIHAAVLTGSVTAAVLEHIRIDLSRREREAITIAAAAEHRRSAHWLHDDVSSALKLVQMRLERERLSGEEVANELAHLDHELRLRQLDELFQSGVVRIAEVLQPFVRNAQSQGMSITRVPSFDSASAQVSDSVGRLVARAAAVLMNNAIVAGATELGFDLASDGEFVYLGIEDDAGGFRLCDVPAGRGLWGLGQELGTGRLDVAPTEHGSIVSVCIPLTERFT